MKVSDEELESWSSQLPYPMAAVLWSYVAEQDPRARLEASFYFFEVVARYIGIVLLSGLHSDRELFEASRASWQGRGTPPSVIMLRPTLGSWVRFSADAGKGIRRLLEVRGDSLSVAFRVASSDPIAKLTSRRLGVVLSTAVERRNDWRGHDAAISTAERRLRIEAMAALIHELRAVLGGALDDWHLIQPRSMAGRSGDYGVAASVMEGANPRVRARPIQLNHVVDTERLYLLQAGSSRALELVPLIRAVTSEAAAESAIYFFDRVSAGEVRWLSYDSQGQPEIVTASPDWLSALLSDLDAPPAATPSEDLPLVRLEVTGASPTAGGQAADIAVSRAVVRPVPLQELPTLIETAVRLSVPSVDIRREPGITSFIGSSRVGWIQPSHHSFRVTAHVPIELAPQAPGPIMYEIPVSGDNRSATEIAVEDERDAIAAIVLLVTSVALDLGWSLDGVESRSAIRRAVAAEPGADAEIGWGAGTWPPATIGPRTRLGLWENSVLELRSRPGFEATNARASAEGLRIDWADGIVVGLRMDATCAYVCVELDDRGEYRTRVDRLIHRKPSLDVLLSEDAFWHRRVGGLLVLEPVRESSEPVQEHVVTMIDRLIHAGRSVGNLLAQTP